jgi:hypothetical protein
MSSSKKISANQTNAQRSTGPRSTQGKARACLNALRHGLAVSAAALPELAADITDLAQKIAGEECNNPSVLDAAMRVATATVDVDRVRREYRELLDQMQSDPAFHDPPLVNEPMPECPDRIRFTMAMRIQAYRDGTRDEQRKAELAQIMEQCVYESKVERIKLRRANDRQDAKQRALQWAQLARYERYERRAVSRRDTAIRTFDTALAAARFEQGR